MSRFGAIPVEEDSPEVPQEIDAAGTPGGADPYFRFREVGDPSVSEFGGNLAASGQENVRQTMEMFKNPDEAIKAVVDLATNPDAWEQLKSYARESYGTFDNFKRSLYNDPIGVAAELSVVGLPLRLAGLKRIGSAIEHMDPAMAATTGAKFGAGAAGTATGFPQRTIKQRLQMSPAPTSRYARPDVRDRVVQTILEENLPISSDGVDLMRGRIDRLSTELDALVEDADISGTTIPISMVMRPLVEMRRRLDNPRTNPESTVDVKAIDDYLDEWTAALGPVKELLPSEVRALRQGLDAKINFNRVPTVEPPMRAQIREEAAAGARSALNDTFEGIGQQNARVSRLLEAYEPMQRAANRIENNNRTSLRGSMTGAAGLAGFTLGDSALDRALGLVVAGSGYLLNGATKEKLARAIYANRSLSEAAKRTMLRQIANVAVEAGVAGTMEEGVPQGEATNAQAQ
jgi:hypothetical protein